MKITRLIVVPATQLVLLWLLGVPRLQAATLQLGFTQPNSFNESNRNVFLTWNATAEKVYKVQTSADAADPTGWQTEDLVISHSNGPVRWMSPEALRDRRFYRLVLPQPEIFEVHPAFINSSDPAALLYVFGQCLPTNGFITLNGRNYVPAQADVDGTWVALSLNGLPPGTPINGPLQVLDARSNVVATLPVQNPIYYGTEMSPEQLQGPPGEPPASPQALGSKKGYDKYKEISGAERHHGHVTVLKAREEEPSAQVSKKGYDYYQAMSSAARHRGHVTVLKAREDGPPALASRKGYDKYKEMSSAERHRGHVTVLKAQAGGPDDDCDGFTLMHATGEMRCQETDLAIAGRELEFAWTRTYRSRTGPSTAQGAGWDFSYNVSLSLLPDGTARLRSGDGRSDTFYPDGTNGWVRNEFFITLGDIDGDGYPETATFADTGKWIFRPQVSGDAASGKLSEIVDRNGNRLRCEYDPPSGRLLRVVDTLGRTNTIAYNAAGLVESVTDFSGRSVRYEYDGSGNLVACVSPPVTGTPHGNDFPGGKTNRYAYTSGFSDARLNHNLTRCTDANGQTWLQVVYQRTSNPASLDFDAVATVLRGVDKQDIRRGMVIAKPGQVAPVLQVIINDFVGNVTECFYDSRFRPVEMREFTGRADPALPTTATDNRPTGKLRPDDPDFYETRYEWNPDSLCTRVRLPRGNAVEMVYQRALDDHNSSRSNKRHAGNLRVLREIACCDMDDDGDGVPDTLQTTFQYDPRFGSPAMALGRGIFDPASGRAPNPYHYWMWSKPRARSAGDTTPIIRGSALSELGRKGWDGTIKGSSSAKIITDRDSGRSKGFGFVISETDPRGNATTATYDARGNRVMVQWSRVPSDSGLPMMHFGYNAHGQLTAITNAPDGAGYRRVDTLSYHAAGPQAGYVQSIAIDEPGVQLTTRYECDARGNVTRVIDPRGHDWLHSYNQLDQCVQTRSAEYGGGASGAVRNTTAFTYDANNNLTRVDVDNRDADGTPGSNAVWRTQFLYDSLNRLVACWRDKHGNVVLRCDEAQYDGNDNLVLYRSGEAVNGNNTNAIVQFQYDERNLLLRSVAAGPLAGISAAQRFDYCPNGNLLHVDLDDANAAPWDTQIINDGFDRPTTVRDALGNVTTYAYDRNDNLIYERLDAEPLDLPGSAGNRRYHEWRWRYDALDRVVTETAAFFDPVSQNPIADGASTTALAYAPNDACLSSTDDNGHTTLFAYDTAGRLASTTDARGNLRSFTYDEAGNLLGITQTDRSEVNGAIQQRVIVRGYDKLHRLTRSTDNVGNTNLYAYDSRDNLVRHTDPLGHDTCYQYDGLSRCVASLSYVGPCDAAGITINTSHVEYSDNHRVTSSTDANGNTTRYAYDALDRCVLVTMADGTRSRLVWSPRSNLVLEQDANGTVISNSFDLLDRCIRRDIAPGPGVASTTTFETFAYDGASHLAAASNDASGLTFRYDSLGNATHIVTDGWQMLKAFDGVGNCLSATYPSGRVVTFTYDALDQPSGISSGGGGLPPAPLVSYAYDGPGRLGRITRANNVNSRYQWNGFANPPNPAGDFGSAQVNGVSHQFSGNGPVIDRRVAAYDRSQNKILRAQTAPFMAGGDMLTNVFEYDALNRVRLAIKTKGTSAQRTAYALDGNGNRQSVIVDGLVERYIMDNATPEPADFQMNQYTLTPLGVQEYDPNGNLLSRASAIGQWQYQYDYADRLVAVTDLSSGAPKPIAAYAYDAFGRRIGKSVAGSGLQVSYLYDGDRVIEELEKGAVRRTFVMPHVLETCGPCVKTFDTDFFVTYGIMFNPAGDSFHRLVDELGNALALTDAAGKVLERYEYDDYGAPAFLTPDGEPAIGGDGLPLSASAFGNRFLFHGMEWNEELGWYSVGANYYDPATGRYILRAGIPLRCDAASSFAGDNPWSAQSLGARNGPSASRACAVQPDGSGATALIVPVAMDKGLRLANHNKPSGCTSREQRAMNVSEAKPMAPRENRSSFSTVLKTKHDTAKNSIGNIR